MPIGDLSDSYKCQIFEKLVDAANHIDGIQIDLKKPEYQNYKDALAFLVEGMAKMYEPSQTKLMLRDLVKTIKKCNKNKNPNEARALLHSQISTLYQASINNKVNDKKLTPAELADWKQVNELYAYVMEHNLKKMEKGKPVEFGGIRRDLLPAWYVNKYVQPSTTNLD